MLESTCAFFPEYFVASRRDTHLFIVAKTNRLIECHQDLYAARFCGNGVRFFRLFKIYISEDVSDPFF